jgi:hypothetical protein
MESTEIPPPTAENKLRNSGTAKKLGWLALHSISLLLPISLAKKEKQKLSLGTVKE